LVAAHFYLPHWLRWSLTQPSWQATVGDIVPREQVPAAVMANGMSFNLMRSIGPALGGVIIVTVGAAVAFAINAVSYIAFTLNRQRFNGWKRFNLWVFIGFICCNF
jgi:hypothetical protein